MTELEKTATSTKEKPKKREAVWNEEAQKNTRVLLQGPLHHRKRSFDGRGSFVLFRHYTRRNQNGFLRKAFSLL